MLTEEEKREATRVYKRRWSEENREHLAATRRVRKLKTKYGMTVDQYEELLAAQSGVCAICSQVDQHDRRLAVDHCHTTGSIRGLLCTECNTGIGKLGDNVAGLQKALDYLQSHE